MQQAQAQASAVRPLEDIIKEVISAVERARAQGYAPELKIKDFRWQFDQISAKMNQAIYNDQPDLIHKTSLETVAVLIEMLARS